MSMPSRWPLPVVTGPTQVPARVDLPGDSYPQGKRALSMRVPMAPRPNEKSPTPAITRIQEKQPPLRFMSGSVEMALFCNARRPRAIARGRTLSQHSYVAPAPDGVGAEGCIVSRRVARFLAGQRLMGCTLNPSEEITCAHISGRPAAGRLHSS